RASRARRRCRRRGSNVSDVSSLAERRAEKDDDSKKWSPADALRAALRDIEQGKANPTHLAVHYYETKPDGSLRHRYYIAGMGLSRTHRDDAGCNSRESGRMDVQILTWSPLPLKKLREMCSSSFWINTSKPD